MGGILEYFDVGGVSCSGYRRVEWIYERFLEYFDVGEL